MELATRGGPGFELWQGYWFTIPELAYSPTAKRTALGDSEDRGDVCRRGGGRHTFMAEQLHWLPLSVRIQFKVLILMLKSQLGLAPKYLCHQILRPPPSAISKRPLTSSDRLDLFVPRVRTTMAQSRSFVCIGPSLWNRLPPSLRSTILSSSISTSFSHLKTFFFPRSTSHWERF